MFLFIHLLFKGQWFSCCEYSVCMYVTGLLYNRSIFQLGHLHRKHFASDVRIV